MKKNLRVLLEDDHKGLTRLFTALVAAFQAGDRQDAARLFRQFEVRLENHLATEEELILPALAKIDPAEAATLLEEHGDMRAQVLAMAVDVDLHLARATAVEELVRKLEAHARREDALMYRWAETHLPPAARKSVLDRLRSTLRPERSDDKVPDAEVER